MLVQHHICLVEDQDRRGLDEFEVSLQLVDVEVADPLSAHEIHRLAARVVVPLHQILVGVDHPDGAAVHGLGAQPSCESCDQGLAEAARHLGYDAFAGTQLVDSKERRHYLELLELFAEGPFEALLKAEDFFFELVEPVKVELRSPAGVSFDDLRVGAFEHFEQWESHVGDCGCHAEGSEGNLERLFLIQNPVLEVCGQLVDLILLHQEQRLLEFLELVEAEALVVVYVREGAEQLVHDLDVGAFHQNLEVFAAFALVQGDGGLHIHARQNVDVGALVVEEDQDFVGLLVVFLQVVRYPRR